MALGLTDRQNYEAIAAAIRNKNGTDTTYTPAEMAAAIEQIETGITLAPLDNPATAERIEEGFQAYNSNGEVIVGTGVSWENAVLITTEEIDEICGQVIYMSSEVEL